MITKSNSAPSVLLNQTGGSTVFIVLLMAGMFVFVILVINVGQLVFERIRLQTTVDNCAIAAATVQAAGLNEIADLNWEASNEFRLAQNNLMSRGVFYNKGNANRVFHFHERVLYYINQYRTDANYFFARQAQSIAQSVKQLNLPNSYLFSIAPASQSSKLIANHEIEERSVYYRYYTASCSKCTSSPVRANTYSKNPQQVWGSISTTPRFPSNRTASKYEKKKLLRKWKKATPNQTYAAFGLTQEIKPFLLGDLMFNLRGADLPPGTPQQYRSYINRYRTKVTMPKMTVYAAAKPTGGDIYAGSPNYKPILYQLKKLYPRPNLANLRKYEH